MLQPRVVARRASGPAVTIAMITLAEWFTDDLAETLPLKGALYTLVLGTVVYATFASGWVAGVASALIASVYAYYDYLTLVDGTGTPGRLVLASSVTVTTLGIAVLVGAMRRRTDRLAARALDVEREHVAQMRTANDALRQANATLEAFTYVVSHDLKEPVRALTTYSAELDEDFKQALPAPGRALVERIRDASHRLRRLLDGLLDYSRAARLQPGELEPLRVEEVLQAPECTTRFGDVLAERGARLDVEPGSPVRASLVGLSQVLGNLVLNAVRHNPGPSPWVHVRAAPLASDPRRVEVVVEDDGPGFPPQVLASFHRAAGGRPTTLRNGFGLLIAQEAVKKMGGELWLGSSSKGGAAVHFTLQAA